MAANVVLAKVRPVSSGNWVSGSSPKTIEPTLKPYQPSHSRPAPSMVSVRLCGRIVSLGQPRRLPSRTTRTSAATPALMWTAVPPA